MQAHWTTSPRSPARSQWRANQVQAEEQEPRQCPCPCLCRHRHQPRPQVSHVSWTPSPLHRNSLKSYTYSLQPHCYLKANRGGSITDQLRAKASSDWHCLNTFCEIFTQTADAGDPYRCRKRPNLRNGMIPTELRSNIFFRRKFPKGQILQI